MTYISRLVGKMPHRATWWALSAGDGYGGDAFASPVVIDCRWEENKEVFTSQIDRREMVSQALIITDQLLGVGDYLCLGDQSSQANPSSVSGAFKIQRCQKMADLRAAESITMVRL